MSPPMPSSPGLPPSRPSPAPRLPAGRWLAGGATLLGLLVVWRSFEIRDETATSPLPRKVRLAPAAPESQAALECVEGYADGARRAAAENRPMLVIFRASWCHWCAEFAQGPLIDRRLVGLSRHFTCVMIDADRHPADCRRFGVREFPTVIVANADGTERRRWTGCPSADDLVTAMVETLPAARMAAAETDEPAATR